MSRIFTAGPIDFEGIDSLIEYRSGMHESLRRAGHEPVDQYTEFLRTVSNEGVTTTEELAATDLAPADLPDEPFAEIVGHAVAATSLRAVLESPELIPKHAPEALLDDLVDRDMELLRSCDGLVAYLPRPSCGTMVEIVRAYERDLPIVVVSESPPHYPQRFADEVEPTLDAGIERIDDLV